jgi:hypothetical protein
MKIKLSLPPSLLPSAPRSAAGSGRAKSLCRHRPPHTVTTFHGRAQLATSSRKRWSSTSLGARLRLGGLQRICY